MTKRLDGRLLEKGDIHEKPLLACTFNSLGNFQQPGKG
jgi:hypothetical protein